MTGKIQTQHLERRAYVYVRQSTAKQVMENTESTARQYALADRAQALGWSEHSIRIIDEDLGRSGSTMESRSGFSFLTQAVANGEAGAIFSLEVSRLARCSQDWQRLLALCAVAQVLVIDEQAIYDYSMFMVSEREYKEYYRRKWSQFSSWWSNRNPTENLEEMGVDLILRNHAAGLTLVRHRACSNFMAGSQRSLRASDRSCNTCSPVSPSSTSTLLASSGFPPSTCR